MKTNWTKTSKYENYEKKSMGLDYDVNKSLITKFDKNRQAILAAVSKAVEKNSKSRQIGKRECNASTYFGS